MLFKIAFESVTWNLRWIVFLSDSSNKKYIGSSINLGPRLLDYMQPAYLDSRASSPVIRAIVKYGYSKFCFIILETCLLELVLEREQFWLIFLKPEYNISPTAG